MIKVVRLAKAFLSIAPGSCVVKFQGDPIGLKETCEIYSTVCVAVNHFLNGTRPPRVVM